MYKLYNNALFIRFINPRKKILCLFCSTKKKISVEGAQY